ncbi:uncharacterized protein BO97DRAFT_417414 [Aspergillus homomorphus CBS 101889]|uniref:Uncharacterized protein n=1 Tax=Aspergillus homomorphus (strain CBS 101889) TaxID=1450537 RepID=A0A395HMU5_ASPHC|nr:hypothetical protein BO97DRAFT_417414 [Aspergillus homomorphus CBS 101889]RAL08743.1 hypothetical protein BO97DRAFT_417414 [Aspergillus homomorphus CBS 101889]
MPSIIPELGPYRVVAHPSPLPKGALIPYMRVIDVLPYGLINTRIAYCHNDPDVPFDWEGAKLYLLAAFRERRVEDPDAIGFSGTIFCNDWCRQYYWLCMV